MCARAYVCMHTHNLSSEPFESKWAFPPNTLATAESRRKLLVLGASGRGMVMPPHSPVTNPHHNLLCTGHRDHGKVLRAQKALWLKLRLAQVAASQAIVSVGASGLRNGKRAAVAHFARQVCTFLLL